MPAAFVAHKQTFDALHQRMLGKNITMTVYVDDITLSGDSLMRLHFCPIKKAFAATGCAFTRQNSLEPDRHQSPESL
jgi:hypothetical protein